MTLTKSEARERALSYLHSQEAAAGFELVLLDDCTLERTFGWVFFYDSLVPSFGPRMRCSRCGKLAATAIPNWKERADYMPGGTP